MLGWIVNHNEFFYSVAKSIKQLNSIIYQGAGFVHITVSCSLQQHKDAESLKKST